MGSSDKIKTPLSHQSEFKADQIGNELGQPVTWLINSKVLDDVWQFEPYKEAEPLSKLKFYWKPTFEIDTLDKQIIWNLWKDYAKLLCVKYFSERNIVSSSKKAMAQNVKTLISFFALDRGVMGPRDLVQEDVAAFEQYLAAKRASYSYVSEVLRTLKLFYSYAPHLSNGMLFDPYPEYSGSFQKVAKKISSPSGHTKTLYPRIGLSLLNHALKKIANSHEVIERYEVYLQFREKGAGNYYKLYAERFNESFAEIKRKVDVLYVSAIVVLLTLSAMRKHEMSHIKLDEVQALLDGDVDLLTGRVFKTAKTSTGLRTERSAVRELKDALAVVVQLTQPMRRNYSSEYLFLRLLHGDGHSHHSENKKPELSETVLYKLLDKFALDAGFEAGTLRPHMFRRFFSLMWAWRFETGDMEYLANLLFHNGEQFTKAYASDESVWEFMPEELRGLTRELLDDALTGKKNVYSGFSRAVERYKNLIRTSVQVNNVSLTELVVERLVVEMGYMVMPAADGYCFMSLTRASRAACGNGETPDYSSRSEELCSRCPNFGVTLDRRDYWIRRYESHKLTYETSKNEDLKTAAYNGMKIAERLINTMSK